VPVPVHAAPSLPVGGGGRSVRIGRGTVPRLRCRRQPSCVRPQRGGERVHRERRVQVSRDSAFSFSPASVQQYALTYELTSPGCGLHNLLPHHRPRHSFSRQPAAPHPALALAASHLLPRPPLPAPSLASPTLTLLHSHSRFVTQPSSILRLLSWLHPLLQLLNRS